MCILTVRALNQTDIDSGDFKLSDVVLLISGPEELCPGGEVGNLYKGIMKDDKVDEDAIFGNHRCVVH